MVTPDSVKNSAPITGDMAEKMESLERRMLRLEELSNRQFQDIGHLTQQVTQWRADNDQLRRDGLITAANTSTITTAAATYTPPFNSPAAGNTGDDQDALTITNTVEPVLEEREEVWRRAKESGRNRLQVVYDTSVMQHANYQYPSTFEQHLHRPQWWRSDRPIPTSLEYSAPVNSATSLLSLAKELRMQIWVRAVGAEATLGFNWSYRKSTKPRENLTQVPGSELPRLRLTSSIINEDLKGYAKPVITVLFMAHFDMKMQLIYSRKQLRSRISIIKLHSYDQDLSDERARAITEELGCDSTATSVYGIQGEFARLKHRYDGLLCQYFKRFSIVSMDMHRAALNEHVEGFDDEEYALRERWVLHSTFEVRRAYADSESPYW